MAAVNALRRFASLSTNPKATLTIEQQQRFAKDIGFDIKKMNFRSKEDRQMADADSRQEERGRESTILSMRDNMNKSKNKRKRLSNNQNSVNEKIGG